MSQASDEWYVRFPDGRVVRARTTRSVRHNLEKGRIPPASRVRRSPEEEWLALEWTAEFADLLAHLGSRAPEPLPSQETEPPAPWEPTPIAPSARREVGRDDPMQLQAVGARGMVEELIGALDNTLNRTKLRVAALTGLLSAAMLVLAGYLVALLELPAPMLAWVAAGLAVLVIGSAGTVLIVQMTFVELSRARSARWAEAVAGWGRNTARLVLAFVAVLAPPAAALVVLPQLPGLLLASEDLAQAREIVSAVLLVLWLMLWVVLWPWAACAGLLAPVLVVEECSASQALGLWWQFVREHLSRVFIYQTLVTALGVVGALPLLVPVLVAPAVLAAGPLDFLAQMPVAGRIALALLGGLALTPWIAFQAVANLSVYLNLRYEQGPRR